MDRRSWPWKKKSSDKRTTLVLDSAADSSHSNSHVEKDTVKKPKYVQISVEQYTHLTGLEEQIKTYDVQIKSYESQVEAYEERVKSFEEQIESYDDQVQSYAEEVQKLNEDKEDLNEKLSAANEEITTKEALVKQHSKVAEDAVSGWEKADAEALKLQNTLESVTLSKLTAEDRASHLDGALKECMRQIRNLKKDHEEKLHDLALSKTMQIEKITTEFEKKISEYEQELLRSAADNDTLSRTLQERSNMLVRISEDKSRADAEIEVLKSNLEMCEREIKSQKYEVHVVSKELEIRNEEKNMCIRSAEVANKQHLEGVKKIAKLEAECQRLRSLVRKKLPGPAALAQMKLEVDNLGGGIKRSPSKASSSPSKSSSGSEFSHELLTERLIAMEEETKMLKEALAKRNEELLESRNLCAQSNSKLQRLEAQNNSLNRSNPSSSISVSEDGNNDDSGSCSGSLSSQKQIKKDDKMEEMAALERVESVNSHVELMDDFLEMEKLAGDQKSEEANRVHENLRNDVTQIHDFVLRKGEDTAGTEGNDLVQLIEGFSITFDKFLSGEKTLEDLVSGLANVFNKAMELKVRFPSEVEILSPHCIDKVVDKDSSKEIYQNGVSKYASDEIEELKSEKEKMGVEIDELKFQLQESEQMLNEIRSQLDSAKRSNSLADTQLRCMTESYRSLETHAAELEIDVDQLKEMVRSLENELEDEKQKYQVAIVKCNELEEHIQRNGNTCLVAEEDDETDIKNIQDRDLAAAAEKLAECQETIFVLGKQLKSLRPQGEHMKSPQRKTESYHEEDELRSTKNYSEGDTSDAWVNDAPRFLESPKCSSESETSDMMTSPSRRLSRSGSSGNPTPEKASRGISRFFSSTESKSSGHY